jgi:D-serine deaminase-like pyridoxal phosphate-dependent protein
MTTTGPRAFPLDPSLAATIDTPAVVVDLDRMTAAIQTMAAAMAARGVALRPHAKTHKSLEVGRRQLAAGASGLTVGTLGEAEVFAAGGIDDLFIAYPVSARGPRAARLAALAVRDGVRLRVGLDSIEGARALAAAAPGLEVLVELDSGVHRSGLDPSRAGEVAAEAASLGLRVLGAFTHGGHGYAGQDARAAAADDEVVALERAAESMARQGLTATVLSAGSTPTAVGSARGVVTEERPGTYAFGDRQQVYLGSIAPDAIAAVVLATVVSRDAAGGHVTIDAGAKILGKDVAAFTSGHGELPDLGGLVVRRVYDYHGVVGDVPPERMPAIGDVVAVVPNHICPVVNLVDTLVVVRDGVLVDRWPVDARGRNG